MATLSAFAFTELRIQVTPNFVLALDQLNLALPRTCLYLLFLGNSGEDIV